MKRLIFILAWLGIMCKSEAQAPPFAFQSLFGSTTRYEVATSVQPFLNNYLVTSLNDGYNVGNTEIDLRLLDEAGAIITHKNINLPNISLVLSGAKPNINWKDTTMYIVGRMASTKWHGMIWKLNKNLDILWHKEVVNPIADSAIQLVSSLVVRDGIIVYGMSNQYDGSGDCFIMKMDFDGNEFWRKTIQAPFKGEGILRLKSTKDYGFVSYEYIKFLDGNSEYKVVKYDSLFNTIWYRLSNSPYVEYEGDLIETRDSNYVVCNGYTDMMLGGLPGTPKSRNIITKYHKNNGTTMWEKKYGASGNYNYLLKIDELPNGNLVSLGQHVTPYVGAKPTGAYVTHVLVTNALGDSLNYQTLFTDSTSTSNRLRDYCKTNHGYFFVGDAQDVSIHHVQNWLIQSDTNICFLTNCSATTAGIASYDEASVVSIYPNPAQNSCVVNFPSAQHGTIKIIDVLGNTVLEQVCNQSPTLINTAT